MKKLIYYLLFLTTSICFSQTVNIVQEGDYKVFLGDSLVSNHNSEREAIEKFINLKFKNTLADVSINYPEKLRIDFEGGQTIQPLELVDTIYLEATPHLQGKYGRYLRLPNCSDIFKIDADTLYPWQSLYKVKRTQEFGKVSYENLDIPFQVVHDSLVSVTYNQIRYRTFANKPYCVDFYINNQIYKENVSCNAGQAVLFEQNVWRHTNTFSDLQPDTEYLIRIECREMEGSGFDFVEFKIKTDVD